MKIHTFGSCLTKFVDYFRANTKIGIRELVKLGPSLKKEYYLFYIFNLKLSLKSDALVECSCVSLERPHGTKQEQKALGHGK